MKGYLSWSLLFITNYPWRNPQEIQEFWKHIRCRLTMRESWTPKGFASFGWYVDGCPVRWKNSYGLVLLTVRPYETCFHTLGQMWLSSRDSTYVSTYFYLYIDAKEVQNGAKMFIDKRSPQNCNICLVKQCNVEIVLEIWIQFNLIHCKLYMGIWIV